MNVHKNACLTPLGRAGMVRRVVEDGQTPKAVAAAFGVCVKTVRRGLGEKAQPDRAVAEQDDAEDRKHENDGAIHGSETLWVEMRRSARRRPRHPAWAG